MNFWRSVAGVMAVEITSADPEAAVAAINAEGIEILNLQRCSDLSCSFEVSRLHYPAVRKLAEKRGEKLRLLSRRGLYWYAKAIASRPVLVAGLLFLCCLILFLPTRILFVCVSGNHLIPSNRILAAAEECGIGFGASRRGVRSEKVKNALLAEIPQLQWVGVNTSGCVATVSVRERSDPKPEEEAFAVSSIVAARDGYILSATVTQGTPLFQVGQAVKEGQILISGYTDCGICIQASRSSGEVFAQTSRSVHALTPSDRQDIAAASPKLHKISLLIRKKRINLWKDSGISPTTCGRMYEQYNITLPGGFQLPFAICLESVLPYECQNTTVSQPQAEALLNRFAHTYLPSQMAAGEIQSSRSEVALENGAYHLRGQYTCVEMIGREQPEQIGEEHGKTN